MALTKAICNKVFSDNSSILPRSNFGACGQESSPQSLTAYSLNRYISLLVFTSISFSNYLDLFFKHIIKIIHQKLY